MDQSSSFEILLSQLRQRDNEGARQVYQRFAQRLIGLAHTKMAPGIRQKLDPEDVAQSVLKSIILRLGEGQFDVGDWDGLWGLLVRFTLHRCMRWGEFFHAGPRDVDREKPPPTKEGESTTSWEFLDREPGPEEATVLAETLEGLLNGFGEREQKIVAQSLQGYNVREISTALGCTESKVYRVLARVREVLEGMNANKR